MKLRTILLVESNPITRKMIRRTLEPAGYRLLEATDGRGALAQAAATGPDLVLQSLNLPDIAGETLAARLRAQTGRSDLPIIALTTPSGRAEMEGAGSAGFTDRLSRPVVSGQLLETVRVHLHPSLAAKERKGEGKRVLVVDDSPEDLRLLERQLHRHGFEVTSVADSDHALQQARRLRPDALISDVLMPGMDGFRLCQAVRQDPTLSDLPVILHSGAYTEESDRRLAIRVGAHALVVRTSDYRETIDALFSSLDSGATSPDGRSDRESPDDSREVPAVALLEEHARCVMRQLDRQASLNSGLASQMALVETKFTVLTALAEIVEQPAPIETVIDRFFRCSLEAAGICRGALYLIREDGHFSLETHVGFSREAQSELPQFFDESRLFEEALAEGEPIIVSCGEASRGRVPVDHAERLLGRSEAGSLLITPMALGAERMGAFVLASPDPRPGEPWVAFARVLSSQIAQAIALGRALWRLKENEDTAILRARQATCLAEVAVALGTCDPLADSLQQCAEAVVHSFGVALAEICLPDREEERLELRAAAGVSRRPSGSTPLMAIGEGRIGRAARDGMPIILNAGITDPEFGDPDWLRREGLVAFAGHPLVLDGRLVGVLLLYDRKPLPQSTLDFLASVADVVALGIDRKRTEEALQNREEQLRQAQKMEAVGRLAGGVAHDFNNMLGVITGYTDLLLHRAANDSRIREPLQEIMKAAERASSLTRQLLVFSRREIVAQQVLDLNELILGMHTLLRRLIGEDIELVTLPEPQLGLVKIDPGQIEQILMNLAVNARDAMPEGGTVRIETKNVERGAEGAGLAPGSYVQLSVTDTGCGMDAETQRRIFEPFFTTKEKGKGTGLGLATVYGIVQQNGGAIQVESAPGRGTTFQILLPRTQEAPRSTHSADTRPEALVGTETVLVVEDEALTRQVLRASLEACGYTVLEAGHGEEALSLCREHEARIDLLLTDLVMPIMSGRELAERMAVLRPDTKILFMSGYTDDVVIRQGIQRGEIAFIQKPFNLSALARKVRETLSAVPVSAGGDGE